MGVAGSWPGCYGRVLRTENTSSDRIDWAYQGYIDLMSFEVLIVKLLTFEISRAESDVRQITQINLCQLFINVVESWQSVCTTRRTGDIYRDRSDRKSKS